MPVPPEYSRAADQFYAFLLDARDESALATTHQAYTMVQAVLQVFRRRLSLPDAIHFATTLPVGLRALFVADWNPDEPQRPFADRATLTAEVHMLRPEHNFAPDTAINDVATALWRHVDRARLERVLHRLPPAACEFWRVRPPAPSVPSP